MTPEEQATPKDIDQAIRELEDVKAHIDERLKQLRQAKTESSSESGRLDDLPFEDSKYGSQWLQSDKVPDWAKQLKYPVETTEWKYYLTKTGNLKRYNKNKEA